jgi:hypothetical protein
MLLRVRLVRALLLPVMTGERLSLLSVFGVRAWLPCCWLLFRGISADKLHEDIEEALEETSHGYDGEGGQASWTELYNVVCRLVMSWCMWDLRRKLRSPAAVLMCLEPQPHGHSNFEIRTEQSCHSPHTKKIEVFTKEKKKENTERIQAVHNTFWRIKQH